MKHFGNISAIIAIVRRMSYCVCYSQLRGSLFDETSAGVDKRKRA